MYLCTDFGMGATIEARGTQSSQSILVRIGIVRHWHSEDIVHGFNCDMT